MEESDVDGDHECNQDQNSRRCKVGRIPGFSGRFGLPDFGQEPVAEQERSHENRYGFKDGHSQSIAPVNLCAGKQGHS